MRVGCPKTELRNNTTAATGIGLGAISTSNTKTVGRDGQAYVYRWSTDCQIEICLVLIIAGSVHMRKLMDERGHNQFQRGPPEEILVIVNSAGSIACNYSEIRPLRLHNLEYWGNRRARRVYGQPADVPGGTSSPAPWPEK